MLAIIGFGQGLVMAPLSSVVLSTGKPAAGAGSGLYGTTVRTGNAAGVGGVGAAFFAIEAHASAGIAMLVSLGLFSASIMACVALLSWIRRTRA